MFAEPLRISTLINTQPLQAAMGQCASNAFAIDEVAGDFGGSQQRIQARSEQACEGFFAR
jgi:hypothetical protein